MTGRCNKLAFETKGSFGQCRSIVEQKYLMGATGFGLSGATSACSVDGRVLGLKCRPQVYTAHLRPYRPANESWLTALAIQDLQPWQAEREFLFIASLKRNCFQ
ncbi:hypothetical protein N7507_009692 [Penicillium longicatenatum]|nr:hypothetical protein N7507_009692 [Penicillium longicatenatum]